MRKFSSILVLLLGLSVAACQTTPDAPDDASGADGASAGQDGGFSSGGVGTGQGAQPTALEQQRARDEALRQQRVFYFDFDSSQIKSEYNNALDAHARFLRDNPGSRIRLEGHTDERGSREYNIALGERRAEAVRRALLLRGATRAQLLVTSYGEEQPAALGTGEAAWAQNRRVKLAYQ